MSLKPVILIIGVLVFIQLLFHGYARVDDINMVDLEIGRVNGDTREMEAEKVNLLAGLEELRQIIETIPPYLLVGFEDPETGFVEFLDYLHTPLLGRVEGEISLREPQKFKQKPIPLHESKFSFRFNFFSTYDAEKFFNYLLFQKQYPLQVKSLKISRGSDGKAGGDLNVSLMVPAKLQLPSLIKETEVQ